jgi:hypothetical protein
VCDGVVDCGNQSDEQGCINVFSCDDGSTVPDSWVCDDADDCVGGEDEATCPTFTCADGTMIPPLQHCNGDDNCGDGSDEAGCGVIADFICPEE